MVAFHEQLFSPKPRAVDFDSELSDASLRMLCPERINSLSFPYTVE